jgi:hypothetical protein
MLTTRSTLTFKCSLTRMNCYPTRSTLTFKCSLLEWTVTTRSTLTVRLHLKVNVSLVQAFILGRLHLKVNIDRVVIIHSSKTTFEQLPITTHPWTQAQPWHIHMKIQFLSWDRHTNRAVLNWLMLSQLTHLDNWISNNNTKSEVCEYSLLVTWAWW